MIVVTGASGHIGGNLVRALAGAGRAARALVHEEGRALDGVAVEQVRGDVLDPASLDRAFAGAEVVYHLAARISLTGDPDGRVAAVNVEGTRNVVEACLRAKVKRLVHFSSIHALAPNGDRPVDETRPLYDEPAALAYERSKARGERFVLDGVARGLDAVIVNPTGVIGPLDWKPSELGEVLLDLYHRRMPALVDGGFNWVDARDVVAGAIAAERKGRSGERYLLSGHWTTVRELAEVAAGVTRVRAPRLTAPMWLARASAPFSVGWSRISGTRPKFTAESLKALRHWRHVRHDKATRELGYEPRPLRDTVADTYDWFRQQGMLA